MGSLVIMDIETQCEAIQCSILARSVKEKKIKTKHVLIPC